MAPSTGGSCAARRWECSAPIPGSPTRPAAPRARRRTRSAAPVLLLVTAALVAGCGAAGDDSAADPATAPARAPTRTTASADRGRAVHATGILRGTGYAVAPIVLFTQI